MNFHIIMQKINYNIKYIGVDDTRLDLFENQYSIPEGISYNSYVIMDEKIAVMDTSDAGTAEQWKSNLLEALEGREPDYLVIHHIEPDHSAMTGWMAEKFPSMKIVGSAVAIRMLPQFFDNISLEGRTVTAADGDTLSLGRCSLKFIMTPMVHWPEVMMSVETSSGTLFSADAFGRFGALESGSGLFCKKDYDWAGEARRYYFNICGKYGAQVQKALASICQNDISTICPLHGPVITETVEDAVRLYRIWSSYSAETPGIFIAYASIHGGIDEAAQTLAGMLREGGAENVVLADISRCDMSEAVADAFRYDRVVFAASSYDAGLFPPMYEFIWHLQIKNWQKRTAGLIENGSWAPTAGRVMKSMLSEMKEINLIEPVVTIRSRMHQKDLPALKSLCNSLLK